MRVAQIITFFFLILIACDDSALFDAGSTETKTLLLSDFSVIEAKNTFEIEIVSDTVNKVLVTCGKNLQSFINISVIENVLYLDHDIKNNWSRKYEKVKLVLHTKPFDRINVRKPMKVFSRKTYKAPVFSLVDWGKFCEMDMNVDVDYCLVAMSSDNFGQFKIKGRASDAQIWGWGSCLVRADSLATNNCTVLHRGIGNVYVNASNILNVTLKFSGNVYYTGNPAQVVIDRQGSGMVYQE